jgi:catechol 2,3-dioxygenase-like lactoylglutathione lyase family enzyme
MRANFKVLTLAVDDLDRALAFYRDGMGLPTEGIIGQEFEDGQAVFFNLDNGVVLALFPSTSLSKDAHVEATRERTGALAIGHIVKTKEEVRDVLAQAERAGATIVDPARDRFWGGYSGHFRDPDGHLWEITWHPQWSPEVE